MSLRFPLLIGISGKRIFNDQSAAEDERISNWVEQCFRTIFEKLEKEYPETPKIVLTGAAFGTDMIAANAALDARSGSTNPESWAVAAILPFDRVLFEQDFQHGPNDPHGPGWAERFLEHEKKFASLLATSMHEPARPSLIVRELPKLYLELPTEANPDGVVATVEQLTRRNTEHHSLRDNHYEQVGQFIAESSTIMIAVMPGDGPADQKTANGGTARVVAYRRAGRADEIGTKVAEHSKILRSEWSDLLAPPAGFVWLIDLKSVSADADVGDLPFKVLPPLLDRPTKDTYANEPARAMPNEEASGYVSWSNLGGERQMQTSLVLAEALKRFHGHIKDAGPVVADITAATDLPREAERVRELINEIQIKKNKSSRNAFTLLAFLFVAAILSFEIWAKFLPFEPFALLIYIVVLAGIGLVVLVARGGHWQAISDDYRAVAEMLRAQEAWWSAGIRERVDREHLQGVDRSLARIRDVATTLIAWLVLRRGWSHPLHPDWRNVIEGWIGGQLKYFSSKVLDREDTVKKTDAASWTLFVASGFLATIVCVWLVDHEHHSYFHKFEIAAEWARSAILRASPWDISVLCWLALAGAMIALRIYARDAQRSGAILTFGLGLLTACCIAFGAVSLMPMLKDLGYSDADALTKIKSGVAVLLVGMSAVAGAWRYRTERLNVEAEAHEYHDAQQRFERAKRALAVNKDGIPTDLDKAYRLVHELGRMALTENEAWLKSRRERPLTPVVG
jgi:hypothetical protein